MTHGHRSFVLAALTLVACPPPRQPPSEPGAPGAPPQDGALDGGATLTFRIEGRTVRTLTLAQLRERVVERTISNFDPYYEREKRFRALPIERVLAVGFEGEPAAALPTRPFVLRARDGYTVPIAGDRLLEGGAHVAFADDEHPGRWDPIGPRRADPAPLYLVWAGRQQCNLETHPRPWQLAVIEIARYESVFPHTVPAHTPEGSPARRGFETFARECVRCHAMNREGGRVGPELNVPQSIVEYRPAEQIRAYIRNPLTFRYGAMPAHPHLSEGQLDELLAYFTAMSQRKHDPDAAARADAGYARDP
jgi:mono/diheme cytochrome c family protein